MKAAFFLLFAFSLQAGSASVATSIAKLSETGDLKYLEAVRSQGCAAVPSLVRNLRVVRVSNLDATQRQKNPAYDRVIWSVIALRYITGTDFYSESRARPAIPTTSDRYFYIHNQLDGGKVRFFGIRMSTGQVYFASEPDQEAIIRKWTSFSSQNKCTTLTQKLSDSFVFFGTKSNR